MRQWLECLYPAATSASGVRHPKIHRNSQMTPASSGAPSAQIRALALLADAWLASHLWAKTPRIRWSAPGSHTPDSMTAHTPIHPIPWR